MRNLENLLKAMKRAWINNPREIQLMRKIVKLHVKEAKKNGFGLVLMRDYETAVLNASIILNEVDLNAVALFVALIRAEFEMDGYY